MSSISNSLIYLVFLTIMFPWVGFIPGLDNQPFFAVFFPLVLLFLWKKYRISKQSLILFFVNLLCLAIAIFIDVQSVTFKFTLTYIYLFVVILLLSTFLSDRSYIITLQHIGFIYFVYLIVGFIQLFVPDFLSFMVTRSAEDAMSFSATGRGVRSLTPEPATLGKLFNILTILYIFILSTQKGFVSSEFKKKSFFVLFFNIIFVLFVSRSAYALLISFLLFSAFTLLYYRFYFIINVFILIFAVPFVLSFSDAFSNVRVVKILELVYSNPELLLEQGAIKRLFNIPITLNNLGYFGPFGSLDSTDSFLSSIWTPLGGLNYIVASKNVGGYVEIILQLGVLSLPVMCFYLYRLYFLFKHPSMKLSFWLFFCVFLVTFQDGTPSLVLTWFVVIFISEKIRINRVSLG